MFGPVGLNVFSHLLSPHKLTKVGRHHLVHKPFTTQPHLKYASWDTGKTGTWKILPWGRNSCPPGIPKSPSGQPEAKPALSPNTIKGACRCIGKSRVQVCCCIPGTTTHKMAPLANVVARRQSLGEKDMLGTQFLSLPYPHRA